MEYIGHCTNAETGSPLESIAGIVAVRERPLTHPINDSNLACRCPNAFLVVPGRSPLCDRPAVGFGSAVQVQGQLYQVVPFSEAVEGQMGCRATSVLSGQKA